MLNALRPPPPGRRGSAEDWETGGHTSSLSLSPANTSTRNFASMSQDFSELILAATVNHLQQDNDELERIGEEEPPQPEPVHGGDEVSSVQRVKEEEVESKINAWQIAKIAKINNRFAREDAIINGLESEEVHKATCRMKKVEVLFIFYTLLLSHQLNYFLIYIKFSTYLIYENVIHKHVEYSIVMLYAEEARGEKSESLRKGAE